MKNIFTFLGIAFVATSLMFASCKKEENKTPSNNQNQENPDNPGGDTIQPGDTTVIDPNGSFTIIWQHYGTTDSVVVDNQDEDTAACIMKIYNAGTENEAVFMEFYLAGPRYIPQGFMQMFVFDVDAQHYYQSNLAYSHHDAEELDPDEYDIIQWENNYGDGDERSSIMRFAMYSHENYQSFCVPTQGVPDQWMLDAKYGNASVDLTTLYGTFTIDATMIDISGVYRNNDTTFLIENLPHNKLKLIANNYKFAVDLD